MHGLVSGKLVPLFFYVKTSKTSPELHINTIKFSFSQIKAPSQFPIHTFKGKNQHHLVPAVN